MKFRLREETCILLLGYVYAKVRDSDKEKIMGKEGLGAINGDMERSEEKAE